MKLDTPVDSLLTIDQARDLAMELIAQAKEAIEEAASDGPTNGTFRVPRDLRKTKIAQVMGLLERE